ncbi:MAG TPA: carboxypeptidase regulatory-like domain-containing protein [Gemmatimonadaceae bacterium]|nr:carboxypeptidase regulatory-like domain-containing protein [Gemmatimonadaceae bacterium]
MLPHRPTILSGLVAVAVSVALVASLSAGAAAQQISDAGPAGSAPTSATVSGVVFDSLTGKPLAGALVQVVARGENARAWNATSGASGEFEITAVPRGLFIVGFMHPSLDSLGLTVQPRTIEVSSDAPVHVTLAIPSARTISRLLCGGAHQSDSTGLLIGFIRDADSGTPLPGAMAVVTWSELVVDKGIHTARRQIPIKSNDAGWYALCGAPADGPITTRAELGKDATGIIEVNVPPRGILRRDFYIPRGAAAVAVDDSDESGAHESDSAGNASAQLEIRRGSARLSGVVRDAQGQPLHGAQLMIWGSDVTGSTGDDGTFTLAGLPSGTQSLEVRYVGYAPTRVAVDLASNQTRSVDVTLSERADVLDQVTVYGKAPKRRLDYTGFLERRKSAGSGRFITRADITEMRPVDLTDILRRVPGLRLVPTSYFDYTILSSRGATTNPSGTCQPLIFVDGARLLDDTGLNGMIRPGDIAAIEVYAGPAGAPLQYSGGDCGSILIWTGPEPGK